MKRVITEGVIGAALLMGAASGWAAIDQEQADANPESNQAGMTAGPDAEGNIGSDQQERGTFYACPMHPEVRQEKPGRCPTCGMNLEAQPSEPDEDASDRGASGSHGHAAASVGKMQGGHHH